MNTISELKEEEQNKISQLIKDCRGFFAFSNNQFEESKTVLKEGEKYVSLNMGLYMPKPEVEKWKTGMIEIDKWFVDTIEAKNLRNEHIAYELSNHEAYYTYEIEDTLGALGEGYTESEVWAVFNSEKHKHND